MSDYLIEEERFLTASMRAAPWGGMAARILQAALGAVEPAAAVRRYLSRQGRWLIVGEHRYDLDSIRNVFLVGVGKAGAPMAQAATDILGGALTRGVVVIKKGHAFQEKLPSLEILEAAHPVPDKRGVKATRRIISLLESAGKEDLVICLISGGGSALLTSPAERVSLQDTQGLTKLLLRCGATIHEINTLRKHLDRVKGGGLARIVSPARVETLILSDVIGDDLDVIASGPTVPDSTTFAEAWEIVKKYNLQGRIPEAIRRHLLDGKAGEIPETPKPGDPVFERVQNHIVGNNLQAANAALQQAKREGFNAQLLSEPLEGEARQVGAALATLLGQMTQTEQPIPRPACLIAGGETTVTLRGDGLGGRNQELALGAVKPLATLTRVALVALATDGEDGPTDAAGAVVTEATLRRAREAGLASADFLARNDAYHFFLPLGDLLCIGPTYTNVNDLTLLFAP